MKKFPVSEKVKLTHRFINNSKGFVLLWTSLGDRHVHNDLNIRNTMSQKL